MIIVAIFTVFVGPAGVERFVVANVNIPEDLCNMLMHYRYSVIAALS